MFRVALAPVCSRGAGCVVTGSRSATDDQEVVARAVELGIAYLMQGDTIVPKKICIKLWMLTLGRQRPTPALH